MIYLTLRQEQWPVNYKRVERLYQKARLQVRRRKRKKAVPSERQPLLQPEAANQVWPRTSCSITPPRDVY